LDELSGGSGSGGAALASGLVEDDGTSSGDVEGTDPAGHGNAKEVIAGAADERVKARAFAAEDDDEVAGEIELVVGGASAFVETGDPEVVAFEVFEGADEIDDASDAEVLGGAGAGFDGGRTEGRRAALGEDDTVDTGAIGNTKKSAEVLRVFDAIEGEDKARGRAGREGREEIFEGEEFLRADESDDALVSGSFGGEGELFAWFLPNANSGLAALCDEAVEAAVAALASHENVVEAALAGLEGLLDRVQAVENFHGD
jgi:hypothetical protein